MIPTPYIVPRRTRLVVADDQSSVLALFEKLLSADGHEVFAAADGAQALAAVRQHRPDVVILDVTMPEIDGLEVCRRLKADPEFRLVDAGATPGWEPLVMVSGDIVDALEFNTEVGNMRIGRRANAAIGRFVRLYMRNVAGFRQGSTDKGSIGFTFNVALAEDEQ